VLVVGVADVGRRLAGLPAQRELGDLVAPAAVRLVGEAGVVAAEVDGDRPSSPSVTGE
jgi:hypothetical protein